VARQGSPRLQEKRAMKEQGGERQSLSFATPLYRFDNVKAQAPPREGEGLQTTD